jgi:hypothetical protein
MVNIVLTSELLFWTIFFTFGKIGDCDAFINLILKLHVENRHVVKGKRWREMS